jgi:hypothetical protein
MDIHEYVPEIEAFVWVKRPFLYRKWRSKESLRIKFVFRVESDAINELMLTLAGAGAPKAGRAQARSWAAMIGTGHTINRD